ncbi:hypothetical protein [Corynebacterium aurimucosum]|uniref:hypothetical protein n=1 Tax=Corynebacterium aurimucosum TaxID=169292 RepID=UPI0039907657
MTVTNYVIPHSGFGISRRLMVNAVDPETFLQLLSLAENDRLDVTLCGHSKSGFRVRYGEDIVGIIPPAQSAEYTELDSIIGAGLTPQATAEIVLREDTAEETIPEFVVLLPEPGLCVPHNIPPAQRWGMLNGDRALHITEFSTTTCALPKHPAQLLVRLSNSRRLFRRAIEVHLDDELLATIPRDQATHLSDTIAGFKHEGLIAIARAYFTPDAESPALTVYTEEGTPNTNFAVGTASVIAAATGAVAATAAGANKAHAAIAPVSGIQATGAAQATGSATAKGAQALSLNSAGAAATAGTQISVASTGLKLACAAGVTAIIGGTTTFVSSLYSPDANNEHVTGSALEGYITSLQTPGPAKSTETNSVLFTGAEVAESSATATRRESLSHPSELRSPKRTTFSHPAKAAAPSEPTDVTEPVQKVELATSEGATSSPGSSHLIDATPEAEPTTSGTARLRHEHPTTTTVIPSSAPAPTTAPSRVPYSMPPAEPTTALTSVISTPKTSAQPAPSTTTTTQVGRDRSALGEDSPVTITATPTTTRTIQSPAPPTPRNIYNPEPTPEPPYDRDDWVIVIIEYG